VRTRLVRVCGGEATPWLCKWGNWPSAASRVPVVPVEWLHFRRCRTCATCRSRPGSCHAVAKSTPRAFLEARSGDYARSGRSDPNLAKCACPARRTQRPAARMCAGYRGAGHAAVRESIQARLARQLLDWTATRRRSWPTRFAAGQWPEPLAEARRATAGYRQCFCESERTCDAAPNRPHGVAASGGRCGCRGGDASPRGSPHLDGPDQVCR